MKTNLLSLIDQVEHIRTYFHFSGGVGLPRTNIIYDCNEFLQWKQEVQFELQSIYDRTQDRFVWDVLVLTRQGFNGWKDERSFSTLSANLSVIKKNIDKYYPAEQDESQSKEDVISMTKKPPKVFISHSSNDIAFVNNLVTLLEGIGLNADQLFCSSVPGYGIPIDVDIYDYLREQFHQ